MIAALLGLLLFLSVIFFACFIPGLLILLFLKIKDLSRIEFLVGATVVGISAFSLVTFILGFLHLSFLVVVIAIIADVIFFLKFKDSVSWLGQNKFSNIYKLLLVVLVLGVVGQGIVVWQSGWLRNDGSVIFGEFRDAMWHVGLIEELTKQIPPIHPGHAPAPLTNYHYFYDLFTAGIYNISHLFLLDIYFRYMPFLLSLLLGVSMFVLTRKITKRAGAAVFSTFLTYFCGSMAYVLPFILSGIKEWGDSSFWSAQTYGMLINPPFSISLSLFLMGTFFLLKYLEDRKNSYGYITILLFGPLIAFKVYAGVVVLAGIFALGLFELIKHRNIKTLLIAVGTLFLSLLVFLPTNGRETSGFLIFAPGWYLRAMMENQERVYHLDWVLREETFLAHGNILRVLQLRLYEFVIFIFGNLNVRILGLLTLIAILLRSRFKISPIHVFLAAVSFAAFLAPMLFIQRGSVANTIQFFYYFLIILNIYTAIIILRIADRLPKAAAVTLFILIITASVPTSVKMGYEYLFKVDRTVISSDEMAGIHYLRYSAGKESIILLPASVRNTDSLYVSALSGKKSYYADRLMSENTHKNVKEREENLNKFFGGEDWNWARNFLKDNNISYIYIRSDDTVVNFWNYLSVKKVFANNMVSIYEVEK